MRCRYQAEACRQVLWAKRLYIPPYPVARSDVELYLGKTTSSLTVGAACREIKQWIPL
jgi:hypothetical protein